MTIGKRLDALERRRSTVEEPVLIIVRYDGEGSGLYRGPDGRTYTAEELQNLDLGPGAMLVVEQIITAGESTA